MGKTFRFLVFLSLLGAFTLSACRKEEGEGGNSSLYGRVLVMDYNETFTVLEESYYGQEIDVYIIYGDDITFSDRTRTGYDGTYRFRYLRPGNYRVFAYSEDSAMLTNAMIPVIREAEITKRNQDVEVPEIIIFN